MKEITIKAQNKVGILADVAELLGGLGVNIDAISAHAQNEYAIFTIITNDSKTAMKHLSRLPGIKVSESEILILELFNKPGELGKITRKLANNNINLESTYIVSKQGDNIKLAIKPTQESFEKTKQILSIK